MKKYLAILVLLAAPYTGAQSCTNQLGGANCSSGFGSLCSNLTWNAAATGDTVTGYNIYRGLVAGGEDLTKPLNPVPITLLTYQDTTIPPGTTTLYYKVAGVYAGGLVGPLSAEACLTFPQTAAPTNLVATPQIGK